MYMAELRELGLVTLTNALYLHVVPVAYEKCLIIHEYWSLLI